MVPVIYRVRCFSGCIRGHLSGFDDIKGNNIQTEDAHFKMFPAGAVLNSRTISVEVYAEEKCRAACRKVEWQRTKWKDEELHMEI